MIQFNLNRFGKLAKWSLRNDKRYYVKSFLQYLVIFTLAFLFFTTATVKWNNVNANYVPCAIVTVAIFFAIIVFGSSYMFYSLDGKRDMQALLMLPASNLEKYLMRYATWIILLPLVMVAFIAADLLQYVVNALVGHETMLVMQSIADYTAKAFSHYDYDTPRSLIVSVILTSGWVHSLYALGATFFRWRKHNWICTSVVLIALAMLLSSVWPEHRIIGSISEDTAISVLRLSSVVYLLLIAFNFWLSYRCFCRRQLIGKFINW